jgi:hypothetical protein
MTTIKRGMFLACAVLMILLSTWLVASVGAQGHQDIKQMQRVGDTGMLMTAPLTHGNLSVYLIRVFPADKRSRFITLEEGLRSGLVRTRETSAVGKVDVRNLSKLPLFIQGGEIVAGGKQDRVVAQDNYIQPNSGWHSLKAFCVEQMRWSPRDAHGASFSQANNYLSSAALRRAVLFKQAQDAVWEAVRKYQADVISRTEGKEAADKYLTGGSVGGETVSFSAGGRLTSFGIAGSYNLTLAPNANGNTQTNLHSSTPPTFEITAGHGITVTELSEAVAAFDPSNNRVGVGQPSPSAWRDSAGSSLHLTLEVSPLRAVAQEYQRAFAKTLDQMPGVTGFAFVTAAGEVWVELYSSPSLARAMWPKLLNAAIAEAVLLDDEEPVWPSSQRVSHVIGQARSVNWESRSMEDLRDSGRHKLIHRIIQSH